MKKRSVFGTILATIGGIVSILAIIALIAQLTGKLSICCGDCEEEPEDGEEPEEDAAETDIDETPTEEA